MERGFIYGLAYDDEIRYVGKTTRTMQSRLLRHLREMRATPPGRRHVMDWLRSIDGDVELICLELDPPDLAEAERAWIATLRRYGCGLTNMRDGGGSGPGLPAGVPWNKGRKGVSPETRARMAASARARGGRPWSEESKRKQSEARKGAAWIREAGRKGGFARAAAMRATKEVMPSCQG